jgi:hypothetical protein
VQVGLWTLWLVHLWAMDLGADGDQSVIGDTVPHLTGRGYPSQPPVTPGHSAFGLSGARGSVSGVCTVTHSAPPPPPTTTLFAFCLSHYCRTLSDAV